MIFAKDNMHGCVVDRAIYEILAFFSKRFLTRVQYPCWCEGRRLGEPAMSQFDIYAMALFIASASIFFLRIQHEDPPLFPYLLISVTCAVSNWLGENGSGLIAIGLLTGGSFLLLHVTSQDYLPDPLDDPDHGN